MSRIAVASTDEINIDEHFGRTRKFLVFEVTAGGEFSLVEIRNVALKNTGDDMHSMVCDLLSDVDIVLASRIGPKAFQALKNKGLIGIALEGPITKALVACGRKSRLINNIYANSSNNCGARNCSGCRFAELAKTEEQYADTVVKNHLMK